jgi:endonuclease III
MTPSDIPAVHRLLKRHFLRHRSPVAAFMEVRTREPFRVLVATILSSRTKDETTAAASQRLFAVVRNLADLRRVPQRRLEQLIFPVGFYRTKAQHLKALPEAMDRLFGGRIPQTVEALVQLPGVGRKTANLVVSEAFDRPGICVDVHVHRICNRLGLLNTRTPHDSEIELRRILPPRYWKTWNRYLVAYGQTVCLPVRPACPRCSLRACCEQVGVAHPARPRPAAS